MKRWIRNVAFGFFALAVTLVVSGAAYERGARRQALNDFPPLGKLVDIGGRHIQLDCRGAGSPTVVFESGLDRMGALSWSKVHDEISKLTRACAYSRAGIMWSDPPPKPADATRIANDLHVTLKSAGEQAPFVLVGHSLGGPYMMTFTKHFGEEVAGLVFVDSSHPDQMRIDEQNRAGLHWTAKAEEWLSEAWGDVLASLHWTGLLRVLESSEPKDPLLSDNANAALRAYRPSSLTALLGEAAAEARTLDEAGSFRQLGNRPVFVLTAQREPPPEELAALAEAGISAEAFQRARAGWQSMHDDIASWSSVSQHQIVPEADHYLQLERPESVIAAIHWVLERAVPQSQSPFQ